MAKPRLNPFRYEPFIAKLEQGQREHFSDYVERNIPRLEAITAEMMEFQYRPAGLEGHAREVRDRHEPPADRRGDCRGRGRSC